MLELDHRAVALTGAAMEGRRPAPAKGGAGAADLADAFRLDAAERSTPAQPPPVAPEGRPDAAADVSQTTWAAIAQLDLSIPSEAEAEAEAEMATLDLATEEGTRDRAHPRLAMEPDPKLADTDADATPVDAAAPSLAVAPPGSAAGAFSQPTGQVTMSETPLVAPPARGDAGSAPAATLAEVSPRPPVNAAAAPAPSVATPAPSSAVGAGPTSAPNAMMTPVAASAVAPTAAPALPGGAATAAAPTGRLAARDGFASTASVVPTPQATAVPPTAATLTGAFAVTAEMAPTIAPKEVPAEALADADPFEAAPLRAGHAGPSRADGAQGNGFQAAPTPAATATATAAARQIADASVQITDGAADIRLDPPELGRVRLTLSAGDGGMVAIVVAERPEVAELLRRHADLLMREFAAAGHGNVDLQFGASGDQRDDSGGRTGDPDGPAIAPAMAPAAAPDWSDRGAALDLRV